LTLDASAGRLKNPLRYLFADVDEGDIQSGQRRKMRDTATHLPGFDDGMKQGCLPHHRNRNAESELALARQV